MTEPVADFHLSLRTFFVTRSVLFRKQSKLLADQYVWGNRTTVNIHDVRVYRIYHLMANSLDCFVPRKDRRAWRPTWLSLRTYFVTRSVLFRKQSKLLADQYVWGNRTTVNIHDVRVYRIYPLMANSLDCFVHRKDRRERRPTWLSLRTFFVKQSKLLADQYVWGNRTTVNIHDVRVTVSIPWWQTV